jgi:hypothetical protein
MVKEKPSGLAADSLPLFTATLTPLNYFMNPVSTIIALWPY